MRKGVWFVCLPLFVCAPAAAQDVAWNASLEITPVTVTTEGQAFQSSSKLQVSWAAPPDDVRRYVVVAAEPRTTRHIDVAASRTTIQLNELKSATTYSISVRACLDEQCAQWRSSGNATAATPAEYWRILGRARGYGSADRLVADGNVGAHAFKYGEWAGPELDGSIRLYYNPLQHDEKGAKVAEPVARRIGTLADAAGFRGVSGFGLRRLCNPECDGAAGIATRLALFQGVPLAGEEPRVRLFFEAEGDDRRTRILSLDSQDGYLGRDFHRGSATRCASFADYADGGGCAPALEIGVDADGARGYAGIRNARQFKVAYPTRDSWLWDMSPGTFMLFTTEWPDGRCSPFAFNAAYAVWNGTGWTVQDDAEGCPKMLKGAQAPAPVHLGGARYKMYFNRHREPGGVVDPRLSTKPIHVVYADGDVTGDAVRVEFEDWEPLDAAREVHFVWADGSALTEDEESRLDDYVVFAPTSDPERLIMYSNMSATGLSAVPFIGAAVLLNP